jgi:hypothetical protein
VEIASAGFIDEGYGAIVADAFDVSIDPDFGGERFVCGLGVRINLVRRAVDNINVAAISFPAGCRSGSEALVGIGDAPIVLVLELFWRCDGGGTPAFPKLFDEMISFLGGGEPC